MLEVFAEALWPANLPFTVLLCVVVLYWLLVAFGMLGIDFEADGDLDADAGNHSTADGDGDWFSAVLGFINIGEVPVTIVTSVLAVCLWVLSMIVNHYWTNGSLALAAAAIPVIVLASAVLTRYLTAPFKPLLRALNREGEEHLPIVGRTCQITTSEANAQFGQAQIDRKGAPLLINVRASDGSALPKGSTGLIIREDKQRGIFYVVPVSSDVLQ